MGVSTTVRREFAAAGVSYEVMGSGGQLTCKRGDKIAKFWPASGRWLGKGDSKGYGLVSLLHYLNQKPDSTPLSRLKAAGYTEEDLELSNPYNKYGEE